MWAEIADSEETADKATTPTPTPTPLPAQEEAEQKDTNSDEGPPGGNSTVELERSPTPPAAASRPLESTVELEGVADESEMGELSFVVPESSSGEDPIIRAKWTLDGCASIDAILLRLDKLKAMYTRMKEDGWEITQPVFDDFGAVGKKKDWKKKPDENKAKED